jgi:ketosteroid isomerase-like protein
MLAALAVALVALDGPDKQVIWVNPAEIVSLRALREQHQHHFANDIECVIQTVDGKIINVVDNCDDVRRKIGAPPD